MKAFHAALFLSACATDQTRCEQPSPLTCDGENLVPLPTPKDPGAGGFLLGTGGGAVGVNGYSFPPRVGSSESDAIFFVDGWQLRFDHVLVTVANITLSENPDKDPNDQSQTDEAVAVLPGPFAVDLRRADAANGFFIPLGAFDGKNLACNAKFDPERRYAISFDVVPATACAYDVNLDDAGRAAYAQMVQRQSTVLYAGNAEWKGEACDVSQPSYDYSAWPRTLTFDLRFHQAVRYLNCLNMKNPGELPGVAVAANQSTRVSASIHLDHAFWDALVEGTPLHFDQYAARYSGGGAHADVTLEDFADASFMPFQDAQGNAIPWRSCHASYDIGNLGTAMSFSRKGHTEIANYRDYASYLVSTQGHLNGDGLCVVSKL